MLAFSKVARSAGLLFIISCGAGPAVDTAATQRTLDSALVAHARLFKTKNVDSLLQAYTEDAIVYTNHAEPIRGRLALRPFLTAFLNSGDVRELTYHTEELSVYGDSAWQILTYEASIQLPGATPVSDHGSGFALWIRDSRGIWRIHRDIFNTSVPLPNGTR